MLNNNRASKCQNFSKYNEELGYATSYLLSSFKKSEEPKPKEKKKVSARKKSTASKDVTESGKNQQLEASSAEEKRRKSSEGEPKWQVGVPRPRLL